MKNKEIGVIGIGHFGQAMAMGLSKAGYEVSANNGKHKRTKEKLAEAAISGVEASSIREMVASCSTIILCIKHNQLLSVASELSHLVTDDHLVLSCLAQATLTEVSSLFDHANPKLVKLMTTLGVKNSKGVSAYQLHHGDDLVFDKRVRKLVKALSAESCILKLRTEEEMQLFTALVGCFPGIMAHILHQLELSAYKHGGQVFNEYSQMLSTLLRSTADLLDSSGSAEELEKRVKTPGGVTEAIINSLDSMESKAYEIAILAGLERMKS